MAKGKTSSSKKQAAAAGKKPAARRRKPTRVVLFPTEPTTIPREKIDAAVRAVIAERKSS